MEGTNLSDAELGDAIEHAFDALCDLLNIAADRLGDYRISASHDEDDIRILVERLTGRSS